MAPNCICQSKKGWVRRTNNFILLWCCWCCSEYCLLFLQPCWPTAKLLCPWPFWQSWPGSVQPGSLQGIPSNQVQGFAFVPVEFHEVPSGPFPSPGLVPLDGSPALWHASCTPWYIMHMLDFNPKLSLNLKISLSTKASIHPPQNFTDFSNKFLQKYFTRRLFLDWKAVHCSANLSSWFSAVSKPCPAAPLEHIHLPAHSFPH